MNDMLREVAVAILRAKGVSATDDCLLDPIEVEQAKAAILAILSAPLPKVWFATHDQSAADRIDDPIWTLSLIANETGWETDCGAEGYGLPQQSAKELARAGNIVAEMERALG